MPAFLALLVILFVVVVGVEIIARFTRLPLEVTRKFTHILVGTLVALSVFYVGRPYLLVLSLLFIIVILISRRRGIFRSIHDPERAGVGELWYPIGILLALLVFIQPSVEAYAILIVAVSDGLAGLAGRTFGKRSIQFISTPKTYLGSTVFAVTAFALSLIVVPWPIALAAAVYLALIELLSFRGLDNLILPLAAGVIATVF